eukprot:5591033-Amphidinium_carterae.1
MSFWAWGACDHFAGNHEPDCSSHLAMWEALFCFHRPQHRHSTIAIMTSPSASKGACKVEKPSEVLSARTGPKQQGMAFKTIDLERMSSSQQHAA